MNAPGARPPRSVLEKLRHVSTAALSSVLIQRGFRHVVLSGVRAIRPELRMAGYARTLRYLPMREDLVGANGNRQSVHRLAVEAVEADEVLVIDARGEVRAGCLGDILATRVMRRGGAGIVTDGALLDTGALKNLDLPTYSRDASPNPSSLAHYAADMNIMIACGGVLIVPGDVVVGDADAVIVVPAAIAESVAEEAYETEAMEEYIRRRIDDGASTKGLYPPDERAKGEYEEWRHRRRE